MSKRGKRKSVWCLVFHVSAQVDNFFIFSHHTDRSDLVNSNNSVSVLPVIWPTTVDRSVDCNQIP